jgi:hypothetical protein
VTVGEWIDGRSHLVPRALAVRMHVMLGAEASADESRTGRVCLTAAGHALSTMLSNKRYERNAALDLLAIDALMTFGFEHAGHSAAPGAVSELAKSGCNSIGQLLPNA